MNSDLLCGCLITELQQLLRQAEARILHCVDQLSTSQIWWRPKPELNSIGNVLLHVCGNMQQWLLDGITGTADSRQRDAEFAAESDPAELNGGPAVRERFRQTVDCVVTRMATLTTAELQEDRVIQGFHVTVLGALTHSIPHVVGHAHQVVLLTRLQLGNRYQFHWDPAGDHSIVPL